MLCSHPAALLRSRVPLAFGQGPRQARLVLSLWPQGTRWTSQGTSPSTLAEGLPRVEASALAVAVLPLAAPVGVFRSVVVLLQLVSAVQSPL